MRFTAPQAWSGRYYLACLQLVTHAAPEAQRCAATHSAPGTADWTAAGAMVRVRPGSALIARVCSFHSAVHLALQAVRALPCLTRSAVCVPCSLTVAQDSGFPNLRWCAPSGVIRYQHSTPERRRIERITPGLRARLHCDLSAQLPGRHLEHRPAAWSSCVGHSAKQARKHLRRRRCQSLEPSMASTRWPKGTPRDKLPEDARDKR